MEEVAIDNIREYQTVILAALLHDIGKFFMRGDAGLGLRIEGKHPEVSANFVSVLKGIFSQVADVDLLHLLVQRHHEDPRMPADLLVQNIEDEHQRTLAALVSKADNFSSAERGAHSREWQDYKEVPLMSVLERVNCDSDNKLKLRFHPRPLTSTTDAFDALFPDGQLSAYASGELNQHIKDFGKEFNKLFRSPNKGCKPVDISTFDTLFAHLSNVIYRYTWCIPSDTQAQVPDVSLFDHLKTTAAIAACLYQYHAVTNTLTEKALADPPDHRFCLAVGDMSGIQNYIFDIAHVGVAGGVARRLRARSLYVQLCSEVAAHRILHRLNLPPVNIIMNSGGKFYLLLPNLPETASVLNEIQQQADRWFIEILNAELVLNLAHITFDKEGFKIGEEESGFGDVLRRVSARLDERKARRLAQYTIESGRWREDFFVGDSFSGQSPCKSCGKFPATCRSSESAVEDDLCIHCHRDAVVGSELARRARYIAFYDEIGQGKIPVLGYSVNVGAGDFSGKPYMIMKLNDADLADMTAYPAMTKYLANHIPVFGDCPHFAMDRLVHDGQADAPATFECIAHRSAGAAMLGFLKADVDNLGKTFVFGFKRKGQPVDAISRIATMSRMLDLFFSGRVQHILSTDFKDCYTIFSGGDDLFIVGPWSRIPHLAEKIKSDFDRFTGNPTLTLSAGVLFGKDSFPVARASEETNRLVERSKHAGRERLTVLGNTVTWAEWQMVREEWERLKPLVSQQGDGNVSSAFLYNLLRYAEMWRKYRGGDVMGLRYQPLLAYDIARNLDARKIPELYRWAEALLSLPSKDNRQKTIMDNLGLITSLLIYGRRGGKE